MENSRTLKAGERIAHYKTKTKILLYPRSQIASTIINTQVQKGYNSYRSRGGPAYCRIFNRNFLCLVES